MYYTVLLFLVLSTTALAQVHTGTIVNAQSGEPIGGASIRIEGTTRGTYSRANGTFRLPLTDGAKKLNIRSVGYEERTVSIESVPQKISLTPSSVGLGGVQVTGGINPDEVIRRAIARVEANNDRVKTIESTVYSKLRFKLLGDGVPGFDGPDESITETFSKIYERRGDSAKKHVRILQRRQTANIPAANNLLVFDRFFDFTQPEIRINFTRLATPLSEQGLSTYTYDIVERKPLGNKYIYEITFKPTSDIFPGFEGSLSIVEGTYQLIAAEFAPTDQTSIPWVKDLRYKQRYERIDDSVWVPMYQEVTAKAGLDIIAGLIEIHGGLDVETWVTDVSVNQPIADSLLEPPPADSTDSLAAKRRTTTTAGNGNVRVRIGGGRSAVSVADDADSTKPEFWQAHSFAEQSEEETEAYRRADSIVAAAPKPKAGAGEERPSLGLFNYGPFGINIVPVLDRSTITGMMFGGEIEALVDRFSLTFGAAFGSEQTKAGHVTLNVGLVDTRGFDLSARASVFSRLATVQTQRTIFGQVNFLNLSNLLYASYSDYYFQDGFSFGIDAQLGDIVASVTAGSARHRTLDPCVALDRPFVYANEGSFNTLNVRAEIAQPSFLEELFSSGNRAYGWVDATVGQETQTSEQFVRAEALLGVWLETLTTGYNPMRLDIELSAGAVLTGSAPRQYQFSILKRFPAIGTHTNAATVNINAFGGTEYIRAHFEHNFSDVWWRGIGLPTFKNNRGLDLIGIYDASNVWNRSSAVAPGVSWDATQQWYQEAGFGIGRIPTFVSDLFFLRFDALWPVGGLSPRGSFGWSVTLSSPLL